MHNGLRRIYVFSGGHLWKNSHPIPFYMGISAGDGFAPDCVAHHPVRSNYPRGVLLGEAFLTGLFGHTRESSRSLISADEPFRSWQSATPVTKRRCEQTRGGIVNRTPIASAISLDETRAFDVVPWSEDFDLAVIQ